MKYRLALRISYNRSLHIILTLYAHRKQSSSCIVLTKIFSNGLVEIDKKKNKSFRKFRGITPKGNNASVTDLQMLVSVISCSDSWSLWPDLASSLGRS